MDKKIVYIGAGVSTQYGVLHLLKNGYNPENITIIDKGDSIYTRKPSDVMSGAGGAGTYSDFKVLESWTQGGVFTPEYVDQQTADRLGQQLIDYILEYHPDSSKVMYTQPEEIPQWLEDSPFDLKQAPCMHLGTDYGRQQVQNIFEYFDKMGVNQLYNTEVIDVDFDKKIVIAQNKNGINKINYDKVILAGGKSGVDFLDKMIKKYNLKTKPRAAQLGVRYETEGHYFDELTKFAYDFKLYKKWDNVSGRSFCLPETEEIQILDSNNNIYFKSIKDVVLEDKVLVFDFDKKETNWVNPVNLFEREYNGNLITINEHLTTTEDHIFFVWEKEKIKNGYTKEQNPNRKHNDDALKLNKIKEVKAKDIKLGDNLVTPIGFKNNPRPRYTKYSDEQLWAFGLWFADGSGQYSSKWNSNSFNLTNEDYILDKFGLVLNNQNEKISSKKKYTNYSVINFSSPILKNFLINEKCFKKGKQRGLPESIFNWSEGEIYSFLSGMIDGDGRIKKEYSISVEYYTSSSKLVRDLSYLFLHLNIQSKTRFQYLETNFTKGKKIKNYVIRIQNIEYVKYLANKLNLQNSKKQNTLLDSLSLCINKQDRKNYEKVKSLTLHKFEGKVYDLETDINHNFIAGLTPITIHNCVNNYAAFVAPEQTYGYITANGHAYKDPNKYNGLTNFGIMLEIKNEIDEPFEFKQNLVKIFNKEGKMSSYSPVNRNPSKTDEGEEMPCIPTTLEKFKEGYGKYSEYILEFIEDLNKTFNINNNYILYLPEVKYISNTIVFNNDNFSLVDHPDVHIQGDNGMSRGIWVAAVSGMYVAENLF
jgi:uncharacterized FAD-dependent dehydrogenase/intein/homing endonuclease